MSSPDHSLDLDLRLPITAWFSDESFYSLCCRYHYVSGNAVAARSAQQLFGHSRNGTQHDFPSRIHVFAQRTQTLLGTPEEIIRTRTVMPFFLPWKSPQEAHHLMTMFCNGKAGKIKSLLGLPASRMRAHLPLKACPQCIHEDRQRVGVAYWHLTHQLPGVWVCLDHGCALLESTEKSSGVGRFLWALPHENNFYETNVRSLDPMSIKQRGIHPVKAH